ncbi:MAG: hypothetical protein H0T89_34360 [Deltaproteobacteria bacterium]|nr:hypothetical protein [Deltaproteobacteria bacterium]MDQ3297949.1 hypothetical protein [Myxococcota bacterium]
MKAFALRGHATLCRTRLDDGVLVEVWFLVAWNERDDFAWIGMEEVFRDG